MLLMFFTTSQGFSRSHAFLEKHPCLNFRLIRKTLFQKFGDAYSVFGMIAMMRIYNNNCASANITNGLDSALKISQRFFYWLYNWHKARSSEDRSNFPNGN